MVRLGVCARAYHDFQRWTRNHTQIIDLADATRDRKNYHKAALLYEKALRFIPEDTAIHIQCGHLGRGTAAA